MIDQLFIGNVGSYDDYDVTVKERNIHEPKKKTIKETVPFSNKVYDFSAINGEIYWEERTLTYVFEVIADSPEDLEIKKREFKSWVMNVFQEKLYDPFILDYHFVATFDSIECDDSEIEKSIITVVFTAYPYMISNTKRTYTIRLHEGVESSVTIKNNSSHRLNPIFICDARFVVVMDGKSYDIPAGESTNTSFWLAVGVNAMTVRTIAGEGILTIEFIEEVL